MDNWLVIKLSLLLKWWTNFSEICQWTIYSNVTDSVMLTQIHVFNIIINHSAEVLLFFSSTSFLLLPEEGPQRKQSEKVPVNALRLLMSWGRRIIRNCTSTHKYCNGHPVFTSYKCTKLSLQHVNTSTFISSFHINSNNSAWEYHDYSIRKHKIYFQIIM